jgi:hypothetical protein
MHARANIRVVNIVKTFAVGEVLIFTYFLPQMDLLAQVTKLTKPTFSLGSHFLPELAQLADQLFNLSGVGCIW